ncbi:MAG: hypothetical protein JXK94_05250 [Deltaproteobacteria bacterium]|nr:hypothetical protein [Deltaproteobacteria bacterium]
MTSNDKKLLLSVRYHPFHYILNRAGKDLNPLMQEFLKLMEAPDENKMDKKLFRLSGTDVELSGRFLWDVVLRECLIFSRFMRRYVKKSGESRLKPPAIFFNLHPNLVGKYLKDDSVVLSCEGLEESFGPIYIHFGKKAGIKTTDGKKAIEGAYVISEWNAEKKSLVVEVLLVPESPKSSKEFRNKSLLRKIAEDAGYIYFWLVYDEGKKPTVYETLDQNIAANSEGIPTQVLLHNQLQLRETLKACRILLPFLKNVTHYLTLAREEGLGRDPDCESMNKDGIRILRAVKKESELLLIDRD